MKYAIISDIHANLTALKRVIADALSQGVEKFVCLGDIVGYGPQPDETLDCVRALSGYVIAGNHDDAVSGRGDESAFIDLASDAIKRHRESIGSDGIKFLRGLPHRLKGDGFLASHGDFVKPEEFRYIDNESVAAENFNEFSDQLMFVGHTHEPCIYLIGESNRVYKLDAQDFELESSKRYIVNPGSVGYPRECGGVCRSTYVIYDSLERTVSYRYLPFEVSSVLQRGSAPKIYGQSLKNFKKLLCFCLVAAALAVGGVIWYLVSTRTEIVDSSALVIRRESLSVESGDIVTANLKIDSKGDMVELWVTFLDGNGVVVGKGSEKRMVKKSSMAKFTVPKGAKIARFEVLKGSLDSNPTVIEFEPNLVK